MTECHGYQLLPLWTSQLVGYSRNLMFQAYFEVFYSLLVEWSLHHWDPSLSAQGYQLLPPATSQLVGDNR